MGIFRYGRRLENSRAGAFLGVFLVAIAVFVLFWNEGRSVKRYKDLKEGSGAVVSIAADRIDPANEKKLVHLVGRTTTDSPVLYPDFGISEAAIKLISNAEMYQWIEKISSNSRTSSSTSDEDKEVSYKKEWRPELVDSSGYLQEGRENPAVMKYRSRTLVADTVKLGAFTLPEFLVEMINNEEPYVIASLDAASPEVQQSGRLHAGGVYFGSDPANPAIGDIRIHFSIVRPGTTSAVARQLGSRLAKYTTETGGTVELLEIGEHEAAAMFQQAQARNKTLTWGIRVFGFFMLGFGFSLILGLLAAISSIVPLLGNLVGMGTKVLGFILGAILWTLTVGLAWIVYRPFLGISLLIVTVALLYLVIKNMGKGKQSQGA